MFVLQKRCQLLGVEPQPSLAHFVHHVERQDHRKPQLKQLDGQIQVPLQVRGVQDVDHHIRALLDENVSSRQLLWYEFLGETKVLYVKLMLYVNHEI